MWQYHQNGLVSHMNFNELPFESDSTAAIHELSDFYIEFGEEPKLRVHLYREIPKPYFGCWFAVTSDWFPEGQYLVFDAREVFTDPSLRLPYKSEAKIHALGKRIVQAFPKQLDLLKRIKETREEAKAATQREPEFVFDFDFSEVDHFPEFPESKESTVAEQLGQLFWQLDSKSDFVKMATETHKALSKETAELLWDCMSEVDLSKPIPF
ncbi:hypothetical protein BFV96_4819 [Alteromonas macleodii]|nr:hypothetical protein BFV93_4850 [Alteromonas macleodii]OES38708.1 hypothetical protein BFV96_4819 [Alteromonas macleodii]